MYMYMYIYFFPIILVFTNEHYVYVCFIKMYTVRTLFVSSVGGAVQRRDGGGGDRVVPGSSRGGASAGDAEHREPAARRSPARQVSAYKPCLKNSV